VILVMILKWPG